MKIITYILIVLMFTCKSETIKKPSFEVKVYEQVEHTPLSKSQNKYVNFNSVHAINRIAAIENEYFSKIETGVSRSYGTLWRENAETTMFNDTISEYQDYLNHLKPQQPDSLHCTLYAYEGLKAGLSTLQLTKLEERHQAIWQSREIAGWSIGYLLVTDFKWNAYLIIDPNSSEYDQCIQSYKNNKTYPVWKQPNIPLEQLLIIGKDDELIMGLLDQHEFSWGFSEQGIHTWITRYDELKECYWAGAPSKKYMKDANEKPLFLSTKFKNYSDYNSHVLIVPPIRINN